MAGKLVKQMAMNLMMKHIKIYTKKVAMNVVNKIKGALLQFEPWPIVGDSFIMSHQCLHYAAMVNPRGIILKAGCRIGKDLKFTIKGKHSSEHETSKMTFELEGKHFETGVFNISIDTNGVLKGEFGGIKINDEEAPSIYAKLNFLERSMKFGMKVKVTG
ncbi:hypothetical protein TSUD_238690 [Trifolium subterraneum]|uniref:Uncharacterized protein n=1 Tax=Trifolium subterraneum TaxID=3900 RepID=A0A2Z6P378_TRISU|nr:hypothetical protein TSUD_238690 [Trifolium subterraneum]